MVQWSGFICSAILLIFNINMMTAMVLRLLRGEAVNRNPAFWFFASALVYSFSFVCFFVRSSPYCTIACFVMPYAHVGFVSSTVYFVYDKMRFNAETLWGLESQFTHKYIKPLLNLFLIAQSILFVKILSNHIYGVDQPAIKNVCIFPSDSIKLPSVTILMDILATLFILYLALLSMKAYVQLFAILQDQEKGHPWLGHALRKMATYTKASMICAAINILTIWACGMNIVDGALQHPVTISVFRGKCESLFSCQHEKAFAFQIHTLLASCIINCFLITFCIPAHAMNSYSLLKHCLNKPFVHDAAISDFPTTQQQIKECQELPDRDSMDYYVNSLVENENYAVLCTIITNLYE